MCEMFRIHKKQTVRGWKNTLVLNTPSTLACSNPKRKEYLYVLTYRGERRNRLSFFPVEYLFFNTFAKRKCVSVLLLKEEAPHHHLPTAHELRQECE